MDFTWKINNKKVFLNDVDRNDSRSANLLKWYFLVYSQISYSAGSPRLSDKARYPTVFRLNSDETKFNEGIVALLKHFKWKKVAVVKQDEAMFNDVSENFTEVSEKDILVDKRYHRAENGN